MKSETIGKLAEALSKCQGELPPAKKDSKNPFFKSSYADLASVWDTIRGPMSRNGLAIVQPPMPTDNGHIVIRTILMHTSGEWISGDLSMVPVKNDPQSFGSAITYGRRYSLMAMLGVAPEDDDGEGAMGRGSDAVGPKGNKKQAPQETERPLGPSGATGRQSGTDAPASEAQMKAIHAIMGGMGIKDDFARHTKASRILDPDGAEVRTTLSGLTKAEASKIIDSLNSERGK